LWWFTTEPPGDLDHDCDVDLLDYAALGAHWMAGDCDVGNNRCSGADLSGDKVLDFNDLRAFVAHWLSGNY
jgi:hypothetical protein